MEIVEDYQYFVRYEVESWLNIDSEGEGYVTKVYGSILRSEAEDDDEGVQCGHVRLTHLRCNEMADNDDYDPRGWGVADTDEMAEITKAIYRKDGNWTSAMDGLWGSIEPADLLVINEIELEPEHRGRGVGLQVVSRALTLFGAPCGVAALSPWPTEVDDPDDEEGAKRGHKKLARYAERLGFKRVPGTEVWARSLVHEIDRVEN